MPLCPLQGHSALTDSAPLLPNQEGQIRGQIELHKGGFSKGHSNSIAPRQLNNLNDMSSRGTPPTGTKSVRSMAKRFNYDQYAEAQDILYFPYAGTRASRYLEVSYKRISYHSTPIFPPNDERMFLAVSNVDRRRRAREQMMYDLCKVNAPQIAQIPVYGDNWKFMDEADAATERPTSVLGLGKKRRKPHPLKNPPSISELHWARRFMRNYVRSHDGVMEIAREGIGKDYMLELGLIGND